MATIFTPSMRLCLVLESFFPVVGGGEAQGAVLAEGMSRRGVAVAVVTLRRHPGLPEHERRDGYVIYRVGGGSNRWLGIVPVFRALRRLRQEYDIIQVSGLRVLGMPAVLAGWLYGKKVILRADNNGEMSGAFFDPALARLGLSHQSFLLRPLNGIRRGLLRRADQFVAIASTLAQEFRTAGVKQERVAIVPYGIDLGRYRPPQPGERAQLRARLGLPQDAVVFCFTGRLVRWKGPLVLLQAWKDMQHARSGMAADDRPTERQLVFLGAGGSDQHNCEAEARAFARDNHLESTVHFMGDVTNVDEYLRASDVFVFPTTADSFGVALLEAMATRLPSAVAIAGGMGDYVEDGVNALVVPGGDALRLRIALERLAGDAALRETLGTNARRTAERYSFERCVDRHLAIYAQLVRGGNGGDS